MCSSDLTFEDRLNGDSLTLRPEATAGVVRAAVEHNLLYDGGKRLYYMGPMFRHERPQKGRYRQFHQIGAEALGFGGAEVDAEMILMANQLWRMLGLKDIRLEINSLGQPAERAQHRAALIAYLEQHQELLDEDARRRLYSNPLRILDTKNPAMQALVEGAPKLMDHLGEASRLHFDTVCAILREQGVAYRINPRLVRGMDYYNLTVFEFVTERLGSQGTICGGGRFQMAAPYAPLFSREIIFQACLELILHPLNCRIQLVGLLPPSRTASEIHQVAKQVLRRLPPVFHHQRDGIFLFRRDREIGFAHNPLQFAFQAGQRIFSRVGGLLRQQGRHH